MGHKPSAISAAIEDIKNGINLDIYVTIFIALGLAIANVVISVLQIRISYDLTPLNLSVLFFIAIVLLENRRKLNSIQQSIKDYSRLDIIDSFPETYAETIRNAKTIIQTGIHHNSNLNEYYAHYRKMLENGGKIKILMVAPEGHAFDMAVMRFPGKIDPEQERVRAKSSLNILEKLIEEFSDAIEVRLIDYLLEYSALVINPESVDCLMYLERYTIKIQGGAKKPKSIYCKNDGKWFDLYMHEIKALWLMGTPYCSDKQRTS